MYVKYDGLTLPGQTFGHKTALCKNEQHFRSEPAADNRDIVKGFCVRLSIQRQLFQSYSVCRSKALNLCRLRRKDYSIDRKQLSMGAKSCIKPHYQDMRRLKL